MLKKSFFKGAITYKMKIVTIGFLSFFVLSFAHGESSSGGTDMSKSGNTASAMDMGMKGDGHGMHMQMHSMPDAPIGIMGHHIHKTGGLMMSYQYMQGRMEGTMTGTSTDPDTLPDFRVTPVSMDMTMNMLGAMYGYSEKLTLMAMIPVTRDNSMDIKQNRNGNVFTTESSGVGDLKLSALILAGKDFVFRAGLSIPTGSIDNKDVLPNGRNVVLPYPMQLGSGSYELSFGGVYARKMGKTTVGSKSVLNVVVNDNDRDYRRGNRILLTGWSSYKVSRKTALSARLQLMDWGNISGIDAEIPQGAPPAVATAQGGTRLDLLFGLNLMVVHGAMVGLEFGAPLYQNLDGPQGKMKYMFRLGMMYGF